MPFYLSKKQAAVIGALFVGLLAGGTLLWRQHGAGFLSANLGGAWYGNGWTEIKPRTEALPEREDAGTENTPAKTGKTAPVVWCDFAAAPAVPQKSAIISEVAWMGTVANYSDEWIELKNISGQEVGLAGWQLQNKNRKIKIVFTGDETLPPQGLYLLERTDDDSVPQVAADKTYKGALGNQNEALYLFDDKCRLADAAMAPAKWPAGDNLSKKTMFRRPDLGWQTSALAGGTPRAENR